MSSIYDLTVPSITGEPVALDQYRGNVLLITNVASQCGLTPQYAGLRTLQAELGDRGFNVLAFPSNQFGQQEPGTDAEICEFATSKYEANFPLFSKTLVNGDHASELYNWLKKEQPGQGAKSDITWNFEKFLVDREGNVVARFGPQVTPEDVRPHIETLLDG
jgi:glutathione peroxidase